MPRRLGQHFLKSKRALARIVSTLEVSHDDTIIEIGPGHGELTRLLLLAHPQKIIAVEKDGRLIDEFLKPLAREYQSLEVVHADALEVIPHAPELFRLNAYKIVGNIPYYITGALLRALGELRDKPTRIVFTVQKEVAERAAAEPPNMNLLAASVQFWGKPEIVRVLPKNLFKPVPKVDSAILKIVPHTPEPTAEEAKQYYAFIHVLFKQPRKTVLNNIAATRAASKSEVARELQELGIEPNLRPQNIDIETINTLSEHFRAGAV